MTERAKQQVNGDRTAAGNVCIIISNDFPETDVYDAEAFSVCLHHLCTMLAIDENALGSVENPTPAK